MLYILFFNTLILLYNTSISVTSFTRYLLIYPYTEKIEGWNQEIQQTVTEF